MQATVSFKMHVWVSSLDYLQFVVWEFQETFERKGKERNHHWWMIIWGCLCVCAKESLRRFDWKAFKHDKKQKWVRNKKVFPPNGRHQSKTFLQFIFACEVPLSLIYFTYALIAALMWDVLCLRHPWVLWFLNIQLNGLSCQSTAAMAMILFFFTCSFVVTVVGYSCKHCTHPG